MKIIHSEKGGQIIMKKSSGKVVRYNKWGYIFLIPFIVVYVIFQLIPLVSTIYNSFFENYMSGLTQVGPKFVGLYNKGEKVIERKVPLPVKWIKGLTTVQIYQSVAERMYSFNRIQTLQLFQTLPKGTVKCDYYLVMRGQKPAFSPVKSLNAVCIGGVHRLRLLKVPVKYIGLGEGMEDLQLFNKTEFVDSLFKN
jgi:ABC-type sugar transport system permease subunit